MHLTRAQFDRILEECIGIRLSGRPDQGIYEASAVQNFRIGSKKREYDRIFRYSYTVLGLPATARLKVNSNYQPDVPGHINEDGFMGNIVIAGAVRTVPIPAGQTWLDIADTAVRPINWYQGGKIVVFDDVTPYFHQNYIVASELGTGTYVRIWLDHPLAAAIPVNNAGGNPVGITALRSPYSAVEAPGAVSQVSFESFVGLPLVPVPAARYFWLLTAGPVFVTPTGGVWPGSAANLRDVYANPADGTINPSSVQDPSNGFQKVGFLLNATGGTTSDYGDAYIMLQLDQ